MATTPLRQAPPTPVPSLSEVVNDRGLIERLPIEVFVEYERQVDYLKADLNAAARKQLARGNAQPTVGEILDVEEAAKGLNTSPDSLYRQHKRLRLGYIDPLDGRLKFTEQEIAEYIRRQRRA